MWTRPESCPVWQRAGCPAAPPALETVGAVAEVVSPGAEALGAWAAPLDAAEVPAEGPADEPPDVPPPPDAQPATSSPVTAVMVMTPAAPSRTWWSRTWSRMVNPRVESGPA